MHQYNSNSNCSAAVVSTALLGPLLADAFVLLELFVFGERLLLVALDGLLTYEVLIFFRRPVVL